MNILDTGGAGYIGSVVAERLIASGHTPVVYDNLSEGHRDAVPEGARLVVAELSDTRALADAIREHRAEAVIHLAGSALVGESMRDTAKYFHNNLTVGAALLDTMLGCGVNRIIFSSSCATYGEPQSSPITEEFPQRPTNPYGESKLMFEKALQWYEVAHRLRYVILRYFNAAGATERLGEHHRHETHLIPIVLGCALGLREEVEVYGDDYPTPDGTCVRDYIHVADLADAHILALSALDRGSRVYNLGNGSGCSVMEIIEAARRITSRPIPARVAPRREGDPAVLVASAERIRRELGWEPKLNKIETIIETAWAWHSSHPDGYER